jgi:hypothetical protein
MEGATPKTRCALNGRSGQNSLETPRSTGSTTDQLAGRFLAELHSALKQGHVSRDTEAHLRNMFRSLGWDAEPQKLSAQVDREIERLEREASALKRLRSESFGSHATNAT